VRRSLAFHLQAFLPVRLPYAFLLIAVLMKVTDNPEFLGTEKKRKTPLWLFRANSERSEKRFLLSHFVIFISSNDRSKCAFFQHR
jgi:hypothetical protein